MILIDTSGLLSALDGSQHYHGECATLLAEASPPLLLSPFVLAELDYTEAHRHPPRQTYFMIFSCSQ